MRKKQEEVTTVCYGRTEVWKSRQEAKKKFCECILHSDGAEKERYMNVYLQLDLGCEVAKDELDYLEIARHI